MCTKSLGLSGHIVALDADSLAPALFVADRTYIVPSLSSKDYIPSLISICRKEQIRLVFPLIDPDIPLLADNRDIIEKTTGRSCSFVERICCDYNR